jgi:hypothetical protein
MRAPKRDPQFPLPSSSYLPRRREQKDPSSRKRNYVLVDGKYSYLGSQVYQDTDTTSECLTHYIRQRKEARHISNGIAASGKKSYQAWWDGL